MTSGLFGSFASKSQDKTLRRSANNPESFLRELIQTTNKHYQNVDASIIKLNTSNQLIAELNKRISAEEQQQALNTSNNLKLAHWQKLKTELSASVHLLQQSLTDAMRALEALIAVFKTKNYYIELQALYETYPNLKTYLNDYHESLQ